MCMNINMFIYLYIYIHTVTSCKVLLGSVWCLSDGFRGTWENFQCCICLFTVELGPGTQSLDCQLLDWYDFSRNYLEPKSIFKNSWTWLENTLPLKRCILDEKLLGHLSIDHMIIFPTLKKGEFSREHFRLFTRSVNEWHIICKEYIHI